MASRAFLGVTDWAVGLNRRTIPQAPPQTLATVVALNNRLETAGKRLKRCPELLAAMAPHKPFDLSETENSAEVRGAVDRVFQDVGLDKAFR